MSGSDLGLYGCDMVAAGGRFYRQLRSAGLTTTLLPIPLLPSLAISSLPHSEPHAEPGDPRRHVLALPRFQENNVIPLTSTSVRGGCHYRIFSPQGECDDTARGKTTTPRKCMSYRKREGLLPNPTPGPRSLPLDLPLPTRLLGFIPVTRP